MTVADIQPLVMGLVLLWADLWKTFVPASWTIASRSALSLLFHRASLTQVIFRLLGAAELFAGLLLLLPPHQWWEMAVAMILAATFVGYVLFSLKYAPQRPCSCLGGRETPVSWRSLSRAGLLFVFAIAGWSAQHFWLAAVRAEPWLLGVAVLEMTIIIALSPELDLVWIDPQAVWNQWFRERNDRGCAAVSAPVSASLEQLRRSAPYQTLSAFLKSSQLDSWREGCWRFFSFAAEYEGQSATVVFAVPVLEQPYLVGAAVIADSDDPVLATLGPPNRVSLGRAPAQV